jgi:GNAT superfamily N-acetyltransferase
LLVAEDATGNIVGFVSAGEERSGDAEYRGEIYAIYLRESAQGKGIGTRLMREAAARLARHGYRAMLLWVLADNPSRRFYERLGGRPARSKQVTYGVELEEVGYGWDDLAILAVNGQTA